MYRILLSMEKEQETRVRSLCWEDLLEKEMATPSSVLAWEIPWTEEPGGLQSTGSHESDTAERLNNKIPSNSLWVERHSKKTH